MNSLVFGLFCRLFYALRDVAVRTFRRHRNRKEQNNHSRFLVCFLFHLFFFLITSVLGVSFQVWRRTHHQKAKHQPFYTKTFKTLCMTGERNPNYANGYAAVQRRGMLCGNQTGDENTPNPLPPPFPIGCFPSEGPNRWRLHRHKRRELNKRFSPQCKTSTWLCWNTDVRIRLSATWTTCKYDTRRLSPPEIGIYRPSGTSHWRSCSRSIQRWCLPSARRSKQQT